MFPWVCYKCGKMFISADTLAKHIKNEKHELSEGEWEVLLAAERTIGKLLAEKKEE